MWCVRRKAKAGARRCRSRRGPLRPGRFRILSEPRKKIVVIGSGPIRIGQGIEFDYCSVHCVWALREAGYDALIVNNNPETVSTDFDTSDRLFFEPLTSEDVLNILDREEPEGVIVQFGAADGDQPRQTAARQRHPHFRQLLRLHRSRRGPRPIRARAPRTGDSEACGPRRRDRRGPRSRSRRRSDTRCWSGHPMFWVGGRWRSSTTAPTWSGT